MDVVFGTSEVTQRFLKIVFLGTLPFIGFSVQAKDRISVGVGADMLDLISYQEGQLQGYLAPVYQCVFDKIEPEVKFVELPLKRGFHHLGRGELDALLPLARSDHRDAVAVFAGELLTADYVFVSLRPLPPIELAEGLRYAIPRGFIGAQFIPNGNSVVTEVGSWSQLASMLKYDRIDAAVIPKLMVYDVFGAEGVNVYQQLAGRLPVSLYLSEFSQSNGVASEVLDAVEACRIDNPVSLITAEETSGGQEGDN